MMNDEVSINGISNYQSRVYGEVTLSGQDKYDDHAISLTKDADADVSVSVTLSLPASKVVHIHWEGDGGPRSDVIGPQTTQAYTYTYGASGADYPIKFTGDIDALTYFNFSGSSNKISGGSGFEYATAITKLLLNSTSISVDVGDISSLPIDHLYFGYTAATGTCLNLAGLTSATRIQCHFTNISGDIADLVTLTSAERIYLYNSNVDTYTQTTQPGAWDTCNISIQNLGLSQQEVDDFLSDRDAAAGAGATTVNISGTNAAPTNGAANANVVSLVGKGYTVTHS